MLNRLSTIRIQHNVDEKFIAQAIGVNVDQYMKYEKSFVNIPDEHMNLLCKAFGVEVSDIIFEEKEMKKQDEIMGFARTYKKLGQHDLKEIEKVYAVRSKVNK